MLISTVYGSGFSPSSVFTEDDQKRKQEQHRIWTNRLCLLYPPALFLYFFVGSGDMHIHSAINALSNALPNLGLDLHTLLFPIHFCIMLAGLGASLLPSTPRRWKEAAVSFATGTALVFPLAFLLVSLGVLN